MDFGLFGTAGCKVSEWTSACVALLGVKFKMNFSFCGTARCEISDWTSAYVAQLTVRFWNGLWLVWQSWL
jgi:hypothetical protein